MIIYDFRCSACFFGDPHSKAEHTSLLIAWCDKQEYENQQMELRKKRKTDEQNMRNLQHRIGKAQESFDRWRSEKQQKQDNANKNNFLPLRLVAEDDQPLK